MPRINNKDTECILLSFSLKEMAALPEEKKLNYVIIPVNKYIILVKLVLGEGGGV